MHFVFGTLIIMSASRFEPEPITIEETLDDAVPFRRRVQQSSIINIAEGVYNYVAKRDNLVSGVVMLTQDPLKR